MDVALTRLGPGDAAVLARLAPEVLDASVDPDWLAGFLADPGHIMIVARVDELVVAQLAAIIHHHPDRPPDLYIDDLAVTPALRRQGIAQRLLEDAMVLGAQRGCAQVWIVTETDNAPARALYEGRNAEPASVVMYEYDLR
jgi:ribosomal protein S18 acetylase RimI-like enzyme